MKNFGPIKKRKIGASCYILVQVKSGLKCSERMARKVKFQPRKEEDEDGEEEEEKEEEEDTEPENNASKRQKAQRNIAVSRAAHFAVVSADESAVSASTSTAKSLGKNISTPTGVVYASSSSAKVEAFDGVRGAFSIAAQILANADNTRKEREARLQASLEGRGNGAATSDEEYALLDCYDQRLVQVSRAARDRENAQGSSPTRRQGRKKLTGPIDSLAHLAARALSAAFARVQDLSGVGGEARALLAAELGKARKLDSRAALLLASPGVDSLHLPECSCVDDATLIQAVELLCGAGRPLRKLQLKNCGHAVSDKSATVLSESGHLSSLQTLHIAGCYKLGDAALVQLLGAGMCPFRCRVCCMPACLVY